MIDYYPEVRCTDINKCEDCPRYMDDCDGEPENMEEGEDDA